jgi:hypothetical protein
MTKSDYLAAAIVVLGVLLVLGAYLVALVWRGGIGNP